LETEVVEVVKQSPSWFLDQSVNETIYQTLVVHNSEKLPVKKWRLTRSTRNFKCKQNCRARTEVEVTENAEATEDQEFQAWAAMCSDTMLIFIKQRLQACILL